MVVYMHGLKFNNIELKVAETVMIYVLQEN
jgi:hypothetical protein